MNENNKLLAEFLGYKVISEIDFLSYNYKDLDFSNLHILEELNFHTDWNMLIKVVEKIESLEYRVYIEGASCTIVHIEENFDIYNQEYKETKIQAVYEACLQLCQRVKENLS